MTIYPNPPKLDLSANNALSDYYDAWLGSTLENDGEKFKVTNDKTRKLITSCRAEELNNLIIKKIQSSFEATPNKVLVWSDLHLFHKNIIKYTGRPYIDIEEMNVSMLDAAKKYVDDDCWLIFVGDLSFGNKEATAHWLKECPGRKVLVLGNHDVTNGKRADNLVGNGLFEMAVDCIDLPLTTPLVRNGSDAVQRLWFTHYPLAEAWVPDGVLNVHGHVHETTTHGNRINVSVECMDYKPQVLRKVITEGYPHKTA